MKLRLVLFLVLCAAAFGQGVVTAPKTVLSVVNGVTRPVANATITVCRALVGGSPCSPPLVGSLFKDAALTQPLSNPFTTDANGNYQFAIANGTYTVTETAVGFAGYSYQYQAGNAGLLLPSPANFPGSVTAGVVNGVYYPAACGGSAPPSWCSGSEIGAWTNAAWAACGGCLAVLPYQAFTLTTPMVASSIADSLVGVGTILNYSGSGCPLTINPSVFTVSAAGTFSDFQIIGTSSGQCGIHILNVTNAKISRVEVSGLTTGAAFWLDSTAGHWTERTTFWDSWSNHNLKGWDFTVSGGSGSFARTDLHSCHVNINSGQTAFLVEGAGASVYDSHIEISGNMDQTGGTVISVTGSISNLDDAFFDIRVESTGLPATLINLAAGVSLTGEGSFGQSTFTCSIASTANFYITGAADPCAPFNPTAIGAWFIADQGSVDSFLFGMGSNVRFDGTNYQLMGDGLHNGGTAVLGSNANPSVGFYVVPDTGTTNQTVTPATFSTYLAGLIDPNGLHTKALTATGAISASGTGACATMTAKVGGGTAGNLTCTGTTGASTIVITTGAATAHSFECHASDLTTAANILRQTTPLSASQCTIAGTINANDVITFEATAY